MVRPSIVNSYLFLLLTTLLTFSLGPGGDFFGARLPRGTSQFVVLLLFLFLWSCFGRTFHLPKGYGLPLGALVLFLAIALPFSGGSHAAFLIGAFLTFLFVIIFLLSYNAKISIHNFIGYFQVILAILLFLILGSIVKMAATHQTSLRGASTLFRDPNGLAGALSLSLVMSLSLYIFLNRWRYLALSGFMSFLIVLSTFKKSILTMVIVWTLYLLFFEHRKEKKKRYIAFLLLAAAAGFSLVGDQLTQNIANTTYQYEYQSDSVARLALLKTSWVIAVENFPFGAGLGTFASVPSIRMGYSPVYFQYGLNKVWGLSPDDVNSANNFTLDSYWAHILGEMGFLGTLLFLMIWFYPAWKVFRLRTEGAAPMEHGLKFFICLTGLITAFEGIVYYYVENPAFIIVHSGLVGLAFQLITRSLGPDNRLPDPTEDEDPTSMDYSGTER